MGGPLERLFRLASSCLLHKEGPLHLPLPKQIALSDKNPSEPCGSTCYKHQRERSKRAWSPDSAARTCDPVANSPKRHRRSSDRNEPVDTNADLNETYLVSEVAKKPLSSIENHMNNAPISTPILAPPWTLTDRSLFRLFYFIFDGDLCSISCLFDQSRTCQQIYEQYILDSKYFSQRISATSGSPFSLRHAYRRRMPEGTTRAFLIYMKKTLNRTATNRSRKDSSTDTTATTLKPAYQPCSHDGPCTAENSACRCMKMGTFCEKYCHCAIDCPHRFPGCACRGSCLFNNCLCCAEGRECDSDLCHNCGASTFSNHVDSFQATMKL